MTDQTNVAQLPATIPARKPQEIRVVNDPVPVLDTARFEHMQRIANVMAHSNLVPDALCKTKHGDNLVALAPEEIVSNCFLVVNQAVRWGMDPFAVAQCVSVVHGKLCYEGKLIAAVIEAKLGVDLEYEFSGGTGDNMKVVVSGAIDGKPVVDSKGRPKTVEGTVGEWKTTHAGSPWAARGGLPRMLRYRGAREWSRAYAPGLMLGIYSEDEMELLTDESRARRARVVRPDHDDGPPPPPPPAQIAQHTITIAPSAQPLSEAEAVALVEGGRDDGKTELWGEDDGPPDPSRSAEVDGGRRHSPSADAAAPGVSTTTPAPGAANLSKNDLLALIAKFESKLGALQFSQHYAQAIAALPADQRREVETAFNSKQSEVPA